ncbi:MAG: beta-propeller fold lactonase family protein [Rivularia sp. T60_A2020_040]|nr:beta-propeller fold lactonase family protein [Rivularia sp. T60_A2020_040]
MEIADFGEVDYRAIANGEGIVDNDILAQIDPNKLNNGFYQLRLTATDISDRASSTETVIEVNSTNKTAYTRSETDLTYNFSSLPLNLTRTYNSLDNSWRFNTDTNIQTNVPLTGREDLGVYEPFRVGTRLYLTTPTGERVGFTFTPLLQQIPGLTYYTPEWVADAGVNYTLNSVDAKLTLAGNRLYQLNTGVAYNPASGDFAGAEFILTAADGTKYLIDSKKGITEQIAANGISLVYSDSGITSSTGETVQFVNNEQGFLKQVIAPDGTQVVYDYLDGNLVAARNLSTGNVQRYGYNDSGLTLITGNPGTNGNAISYGTTPEISPIQSDLGGVVQWNGSTINGNLTEGIDRYTFGLRDGEIESTATGIVLVSAEVMGDALPSIAGLNPVATNGNYALFAIDTPGLNLISLTPPLSPSPTPYSLKLNIAGDVNNDGVVDGVDSGLVGSAIANNNYNIIYDFNRDNVVNAADMQILGSNYGFTANRAPVITASEILTHTDLQTFIDLDKLATDPEGDSIYFRLANPEQGSISFTPDGKSAVFTPNAGYYGAASFDLIADDGYSTASSTIDINVSDAPLVNLDIVNRTPRLDVGESTELVVIGDFSDQDDVVLPGSYLQFGSENELVARITDTGVLSGLGDGVSIVSVGRGGIEAVTALRVGRLQPTNQEELYVSIAENYGLNLYPEAVTLTQNVTRQILVGLNEVKQSPLLKDDSTGTRYFVSNPNIISVSSDGLITALAESGTANVTVIYGAAEEIIPVRIDQPILGGEATITADGGVVQDESGATVMVAPGALSSDTTVNIMKLTESQLNLPVPDGFTFASGFQLDISGNDAFEIPAQIAVPAPLGVEVGQSVFFLRQGELPTEDGSLRSHWFVEESGVVGADGMIRTSSPPWAGVKQSGTYTIAVPKFTYPEPNSDIGLIADFVEQSALLGAFAVAYGLAFPIPLSYVALGGATLALSGFAASYLSYISQLQSIPISTVDVVAIPRVGKLPYITSSGVQINPNGTASVQVNFDDVITGQANAFKPPVITGAELSFYITGEPIVYVTANNVLVDTDNLGSKLEDLIVNFRTSNGSIYKGTVLPELSTKLGDNLYNIAVTPPSNIILGESDIELVRQQNEKRGLNPDDVELVKYASERSIKLEPEESNLVLVAQVWKDALTAINPDQWNDIQGDENLTSFDLIAATDIQVGTVDKLDRPREVAITNNGTRAYVTLENTHSIAVVDTLMLRQVDVNLQTQEMDMIVLPSGATPRELVISPDNKFIYIADRVMSSVYVVDINPNSKTYHQLVQTIKVGDGGLRKLAINGDGKKLFVTSPKSKTPGLGSIHVINIDPNDRPQDESKSNLRKWHEVIGTIEADSGTEGIAATPETDKMVFTNKGNDAKGFGLLTITNDDPINFEAKTNYTNVGIGSAFDYFDVNEARSVVVTRDGKYAFVAGYNGRLFGTGIESIDGPLSGSNIGIIADPLTENAKMVAATRPIPMGLTTDLVLNGGNGNGGYIDDKFLYAAYPGVNSVFGFDVEEIIDTLEYAKANPNPNIDFTKKPIDEINPYVVIAGDLIPFELGGGRIKFVTPDGSVRPPLGIGSNPWGLGSVSKRDWLELVAPDNTTTDTTPTFEWKFDQGYENVREVNLFVSTFGEGEGLLPTDKLVDLSDSSFLPQLNEQKKRELLTDPWNRYDDYNPGRILTATWKRETNTWYDHNGSVIVALENDPENTSTSFTLNKPLGTGNFNVAVRGISNEGEEEIETDKITIVPQPTETPFSSVTMMTHGFTPPIIEPLFVDEYGIPKDYYKIADSIVTRPGKEVDEKGLIMRYNHATGYWVPVDKDGKVIEELTGKKDVEEDGDYWSTLITNLKEGVEIDGKEVKFLGENKPLVLLPTWSKKSENPTGNESAIPDSGFTEAAADAFFASLVMFDQELGGDIGEKDNNGNLVRLYDEKGKLIRKQGDIFDSPLHFIGFSRGTVVNSEIIQRLGTYFPNAGGVERDEEGKINRGTGDLQMTALDPHDFYQPSLAIEAFRDFYEPKVQVWDNVTFADNYYQTVADPNGLTATPNGRNIPELPESETSKNPQPAGLKFPNGGQTDYTVFLSDPNLKLTGFDRDNGFGGPHGQVMAWYAGTIDLSLEDINVDGRYSDKPLKEPKNASTPIYDRQGEEDVEKLLGENNPSELKTWYSKEGTGEGWYYSVLGGGEEDRQDKYQNINTRIPVTFDNTYDARMRGDYAVPTLFNGNFDAVFQPEDGFRNVVSSAIPGWSFHGGTSNGSQASLVKWEEVGSLQSHREKLGYNPEQPNYALELASGESIIHNRFTVPDWGVLRFDLHTPNPGNGELKVSIKEANATLWEELNPINLSIAHDPHTLNPNDNDLYFRKNAIGYYDYSNGIYSDPYSYKLAYAVEGFETFHLEVPEYLRGKSALLKFELDGNNFVYLDDIFFNGT